MVRYSLFVDEKVVVSYRNYYYYFSIYNKEEDVDVDVDVDWATMTPGLSSYWKGGIQSRNLVWKLALLYDLHHNDIYPIPPVFLPVEKNTNGNQNRYGMSKSKERMIMDVK